MANLPESPNWEVGIYQFETTDPVMGGAEGIDNLPIKQLANRTLYLKNQITTLGNEKQASDATLKALAGLTTAADTLPYATGVDTFSTTPLTAFARTLLDDANSATALATLGAAPSASPMLTGAPTAPTAPVDTSTTQIATTAFVTNQASATTPIVDGTAAVGTSKRYARADHVHPTDTSRAAAVSFASSKATNGWQKIEGGLIIQWGTTSFVANNGTAVQTTVAFPIAFPSACVHISGVQTSRASNDGGGTWAMRPTNKTSTNFLATLDNNGGSALYNFTLAQTAEWIAIGY